MSLLDSQNIGHTQGLSVMGWPQAVIHGSLILPLLPTPWTIGIARKVPKSIRVMDSLESHDLWRFHVGYCP